jgi:hypothetical protein
MLKKKENKKIYEINEINKKDNIITIITNKNEIEFEIIPNDTINGIINELNIRGFIFKDNILLKIGLNIFLRPIHRIYKIKCL